MHWARLPSLVAAVACALLGSLYVSPPAGAVFPGKPGRLVFDAVRGYDATVLWDYAPNTQKRRQLTRPLSSCRFDTNGVDDAWSDRTPDYSPGGRLIAYIHGDTCPGGNERDGIWVVRADGSSQRIVARPSALGVSPQQLAFSPDGRRIAVLADDNLLNQHVQLLYDAQTGKLLRRRNWNTNRLRSPGTMDWGANGKLAVGTDDGVRRLLPRGALAERLSFPPPDGPSFFASDSDPDWSPSGRTFAFVRLTQHGVDDGASARAAQVRLRYSIWRAPTRRRNAAVRLVRSPEVLFEPVFSPDGRWLAYGNHDGINVMSSRGGRTRLMLRGDRIASAIDWQARR